MTPKKQRWVFVLIALVGEFLLTGCQSQFDKCFKAEYKKLQDAEEFAMANHPVLAAYDELQKYSEEFEKSLRIAVTTRLQFGHEPEKCKTQNYPKDEDCAAFRDSSDEAVWNALVAAGFSESTPPISSYETFINAAFDYRYGDGRDDEPEKSEEFEEKMDRAESSFEKSYAHITDDDIEGNVKKEIAQLAMEYEVYFEDITAPIIVANPDDIAVQICNERGLYK